MHLKKLLLMLAVATLTAAQALADDDIMITRDGTMTPVKIEKISASQVTFTDLKHKKRGRLNAPADFVYMIMKEKGNNIFFDEEGNQTTAPVVSFDKKDNVMFLNRGEMFVVYNVTVSRDAISYQLRDKKKAPWIKSPKSDVFMIRNADGTATLFNDNYQKRQQQAAQQKQAQQQAQQQAAQQLAAQQQAAAAVTPQATSPTPAPQASTPAATAPQGGQPLIASQVAETGFSPAPTLDAQTLETLVNARNPYLLYRKGAVAEYCFQEKGKQTSIVPMGPTYMLATVTDEKIENGLLVCHVQHSFLNKKHEPSKGIAAGWKEMVFPTEIDTSGTYHMTHNMMCDMYAISKRQGFGILIPGVMTPGMRLKCGTIYDNAKNGLGGIAKVETVYSDWQVAGEQQLQTPAGTFDCVKLTGHIAVKDGSNGKFVGQEVTCWLARGVGIVQYERVPDGSKDNEPFVVYLNRLEMR